MVIYASRSRFRSLFGIGLIAAITVQAWRSAGNHLIIGLLTTVVALTAIWLLYVLLYLHRVVELQGGRIIIRSYFGRRVYDITQVERLSVARSGLLLRVAEVRTLKLQVKGRLEKFYMPDFSVRELDKLVLILSRTGAPIALPEFSLN
jgi:hypothetical protein